MTDQAPKQEAFDSWAVIELMGRQTIAGRVTEQVIGGTAFIRVDVPDQPERKATTSWDSDSPAIPAYTRYLGGAAIYAINPCSEEIAKRAAQGMRQRPAIPYAEPRTALPAPGDGDFMDDR